MFAGDFHRASECGALTLGVLGVAYGVVDDLRVLGLGGVRGSFNVSGRAVFRLRLQSEGILAFAALCEGDLDVDLALLAVLGERIVVLEGEGVVDRDGGGHMRVEAVGDLDDLTVAHIAFHHLGEASGLADDIEAVEHYLGVFDGAGVDDDRDDCLISLAVRAIECRHVVLPHAARKREGGVLFEDAAPACGCGCDLAPVIEDESDARSVEALGCEIVAEGRVRERVYGHGAELGFVDSLCEHRALAHCDVGEGAVGGSSERRCRRLHLVVVGKGDDDFAVRPHAARLNGEPCHVVVEVGVIDKAVPIEARRLGPARRAVHHDAALGH